MPLFLANETIPVCPDWQQELKAFKSKLGLMVPFSLRSFTFSNHLVFCIGIISRTDPFFLIKAG